MRLSVMVPDLSEARRVFMFVEGLPKPLRELVKSNRPTTLQDAVGKAQYLQDALPRTRALVPPRQGF